jgi:hypothetical protein
MRRSKLAVEQFSHEVQERLCELATRDDLLPMPHDIESNGNYRKS